MALGYAEFGGVRLKADPSFVMRLGTSELAQRLMHRGCDPDEAMVFARQRERHMRSILEWLR